MDISWDSFKINNPDVNGIHDKFENLCRRLFDYEFLSKNSPGSYLHRNHNNPGIEAEPIYSVVRKQMMGFQAKYFEKQADYKQVEHSAIQTVKHYGKNLDVVYLYCNLSLSNKSLEKTRGMLREKQIGLELCTDQAILDLVSGKYHDLAYEYFGVHIEETAYSSRYKVSDWDKGNLINFFNDFNLLLKICCNEDRTATPMLINLPLAFEILYDKWKYYDTDFSDPYLNSLKYGILRELDSYFWYWGLHMFPNGTNSGLVFIDTTPAIARGTDNDPHMVDRKFREMLLKLYKHLCDCKHAIC